jgi:signal transduction histidine kinase
MIRPRRPSSPLGLAKSVLLLAAAYYLAARVGLAFRFQHSLIGVVWLANAILLSGLLLIRRREWWLVFVVTGLAHAAAIGSNVPAWRLLWQIAGNALFAAATVEVLRRFAGFPLQFGSRRQVFVYVATVLAMPVVFGVTTPAFVRSALGLEATINPARAVMGRALSNATALLVLVPVIVLWGQYGLRRLPELRLRRLLEATAIIISLLAVGVLAFATGPEIARLPWLMAWIFPPLLWAAVRFGPIGASSSLLVVMALSAAGAARQLGPFVYLQNADQVLSMQLFWIVLCPPMMLLAAAIRERDQVEAALQEQRNQLAHVTRVATVGELSGALAHELRQPLMSILANAQAAQCLLTRPPVDLGELRAILHDITQQDQQAASVIARVRSFLREGNAHFEDLAVETVVRDALALGRSAIVISRVDVRTQIAGGLPRVWGDPVQLLQVVLNLIVNGCESMSRIPPPDRYLRLQVGKNGSNHVEVQVTDLGVGLPDGREDSVFEPFFTTKDKGLGLGLAIGRSIATAHGGRLWGENNRNGGATFHLVLPATGHHQWQPRGD